jgi:bacteriorhodopsin
LEFQSVAKLVVAAKPVVFFHIVLIEFSQVEAASSPILHQLAVLWLSYACYINDDDNLTTTSFGIVQKSIFSLFFCIVPVAFQALLTACSTPRRGAAYAP